MKKTSYKQKVLEVNKFFSSNNITKQVFALKRTVLHIDYSKTPLDINVLTRKEFTELYRTVKGYDKKD